MLNVGGGELVVILLVALIFLGPAKLPEAARQMGRAFSELRRIGQGFQREMRDAMDATIEQDARARGDALQKADPVPPSAAGSPADVAGMYHAMERSEEPAAPEESPVGENDEVDE